MSFSNRELFARLIKCEAGGEGENGMKAVATVIMNRAHATRGQYLKVGQGSIRKIINQPGEFTCLLSTVYGEVNLRNIWNSPPETEHYEIADWAISGHRLSGAANCLWYYNPYSKSCPKYFPPNRTGSMFNRIHNHCFYLPTPKYYKT